jgi:hypothetical protein
MDLVGPETNEAVGLDADIQGKIGQQLRLMYREVVEQGVPDRFVDILKGLDESKLADSKDEGPHE